MKFEKNSKYTTIAIYSFVTVCAIICFLACFIYHKELFSKIRFLIQILNPFFYAFAIAYIINPAEKFIYSKLARLFEKKPKPVLQKVLSITLTYCFIILCITGFFLIIIPQVGESIIELYSNLPEVFKRVTELMNKAINSLEENGIWVYNSDDVKEILNKVYDFAKTYMPKLIDMTTKTASWFKNFIYGLFISVYMLAGKERFKKQFKKLLNALFPKKTVENVLDFSKITNEMFGGFINAKILEAAIIGVLCYIGMKIFRMPYPALISLIIGVTDLIPFFGPIIGAVPCAIIILIVSPVKMLWFIVFIIALQQIEGHIVSPKVLGESTGLPSFWVMFALIFMGGYFGVFGMIISVPVFGLIYYMLKRFCNKQLIKKGLPTDTDYYK